MMGWKEWFDGEDAAEGDVFCDGWMGFLRWREAFMDGFYGQMPFGRNPLCPLAERGPNKSERAWERPSGGRPGGIEALKSQKAGRAVFWERENPLAGIMDDPGRLGDDFLDHRLDATALGRMARRSIGPQQGRLTIRNTL